MSDDLINQAIKIISKRFNDSVQDEKEFKKGLLKNREILLDMIKRENEGYIYVDIGIMLRILDLALETRH